MPSRSMGRRKMSTCPRITTLGSSEDLDLLNLLMSGMHLMRRRKWTGDSSTVVKSQLFSLKIAGKLLTKCVDGKMRRTAADPAAATAVDPAAAAATAADPAVATADAALLGGEALPGGVVAHGVVLAVA